jgi:hypothetical protein
LEKSVIEDEMTKKAFWDHITGSGHKSPWKYFMDELGSILDTAFFAWIGVFLLSNIISNVAEGVKKVAEGVKEGIEEAKKDATKNIIPEIPETFVPTALSITKDGYVQYIDSKGKKHFANPGGKGKTLSVHGENIIITDSDGSFRIRTLQDLFPGLFKNDENE